MVVVCLYLVVESVVTDVLRFFLVSERYFKFSFLVSDIYSKL